MPPSPALYPVFLKLADLPVVVVGGGPIAAGKLDGLLVAGARVTVIAPEITGAIRALEGKQLRLVKRAFVPADLDGARWVVAAAPPAVNLEVAAAVSSTALMNRPRAAATAYLGGVIRRGEVEVAISTGGTAPALAGLLREALDALLPAEIERWVEVAKRARADWKRSNVPITQRRSLLLRTLVQLYRADALVGERGAA